MSNFNRYRTIYVPDFKVVSEPRVVISDDSVSFVFSNDDGSNIPPPETMTIKNQIDSGLPLSAVNTSILSMSDDVADALLSDLSKNDDVKLADESNV